MTPPSNPAAVALCVTCLVDQILPEVGVASVRLLRRAGYQVVFPRAQTCCGQPFFNSGFRDQAARLAKRLIEIFEAYDTIVLPSGSCTTMIRVEYAHLLAPEPEWQARAERLAGKTFELSEFLAGLRDERRQADGEEISAGRPGPTVTYHDSCHMCRQLKLATEPRSLLEDAGCRLEEMVEPDRCCGFGGLFSLKMPEVSNAMTAVKLEQARETQAAVLVTADPGCLIQMRGLANTEPHVEHLATVLEKLTRPTPPQLDS